MKASRTIDMARLRKAISGPGVDTRVHVSYGTVATDAGEDGGPNFEDDDAVVVSPLGTVVDVLLEPHGIVVPCRYGLNAGAAFVGLPIRPGDQVVVLIPDGDLAAGPEIVKVIPAADRQNPVGDDGLPTWRNDRVSVVARGVPLDLSVEGKAKISIAADGTIDLVVEGGGRVQINPDGTTKLGGPSATQSLVMGDLYRQAEALANNAAALALTQVAAPAATWAGGEAVGAFGGTYPETTALIAAVVASLAAVAAAIQAFESGAAAYLSSASKTT